MRVEILSAAETELTDAVSYYNGQSEGLGYEFAAEIKQTIARILQFPDAWTQLSAFSAKVLDSKREEKLLCKTQRSHGYRLYPSCHETL